jgi:hypothetical protein
MNQRLCALALLLLTATGLGGCGAGGIQPCNESPYASSGPCSVGRAPTIGHS